MLKIWGRVNSINVMKVMWCVEELGIPHERVDAGMAYGVVGDDFYGKLNPNRRIPTIEDDGLVLWESNVIVRYLSAKYGAGSLCPTDVGERALAEQWMDWQQTTAHADITFIFWAVVRDLKENQVPEKLNAAASRLGKNWKIVDDQLAGREFLCGDRLTMADIPLGTAVWRWYNMDTERPSLPNVEAWHERLKQRPGFQKYVMQPLT
jgi:glutathione S-transferase